MNPTERLAFDRAINVANDDGKWITIKGARVKIDDDGNIIAGAEGKIPKRNDGSTQKEDAPDFVKGMKLGERQSSAYRNWSAELSKNPEEGWKKRQNDEVKALFKDAETSKEARALMKKFLSGSPSAVREVSQKYRSRGRPEKGAMDGATEVLAFDRASVRSFDGNGRLQIAKTNISKANVCPYYGKEIPDWENLGLEPGKIYQLWRHPDELKKAAHTFNSIPVLDRHVPDFPSDPPREFRVGATHSNCEFDGTYLTVGMTIYDDSAIAGIETGEQRELSASYQYVADMTPGVTPDGVPHDGIMRDIVGNHEALVEQGRVGSDVLVADSLPTGIKRMSELTKKVMAAIAPLLAQDAKPEEIEAAVEKVAKDEETRAERDNESEADRLKREEKELKDREKRENKDRERDRAEDEDDDDEDKKKKTADDEGDDDDKKVSKTAMDSAIRLAADSARREASADFRKLREAELAVRPLIGDVVAMDSADDVFRTALEQSGIDIDGVHPSAFPALVRMAISQKENSRPVIAQDSASVSDFEKAFPTAGKLKRGF